MRLSIYLLQPLHAFTLSCMSREVSAEADWVIPGLVSTGFQSAQNAKCASAACPCQAAGRQQGAPVQADNLRSECKCSVSWQAHCISVLQIHLRLRAQPGKQQPLSQTC